MIIMNSFQDVFCDLLCIISDIGMKGCKLRPVCFSFKSFLVHFLVQLDTV